MATKPLKGRDRMKVHYNLMKCIDENSHRISKMNSRADVYHLVREWSGEGDLITDNMIAEAIKANGITLRCGSTTPKIRRTRELAKAVEVILVEIENEIGAGFRFGEKSGARSVLKEIAGLSEEN